MLDRDLTDTETTALAELRRIHSDWSITTDDGEFVAVRTEPDDVIRAALVETLGRRLYAAQCPDRRYRPAGTPTRVDQLQRGNLVRMAPGHLRVITNVQRPPSGVVELRLGTTWHAYNPDQELDLAERRRLR
ncbi:hypothetical protein [Nocardiopsis sp. Huas11]|uniref:hypothetical protein n=1 Tax=Nocardiopsis sp. Huas11 TaxID=2183912 RepID=UPI000EAD510A|nr:hypothetical protein [Nocardiopsis sp. Huas11]